MEEDHSQLFWFYRQMERIRQFEETVLEQFSKGIFFGTTHTYLGQEANAVGILSHLSAGDIVLSNHRCHGHFLAYGGDMRALFAELMGKATGVCGGWGGSQHLHWQNFYSNGVLGGTAPLAVGMALAEKIKGSGAVVVLFLGDGALGEGVVYEALNLASLWQAPVLVVIENNHIAQTTPFENVFSGDLPSRLNGFGIPCETLDTSNVTQISATAEKLLLQVRRDQKPAALVIHTCRFGPHSKGDDTRPAETLEQMRNQRDPLKILGQQLPDATRQQIIAEVKAEVKLAFEQATKDPFPDPDQTTHPPTGEGS